ncbi:MAG: EAL domain-containing protein [Alphaproteobacteria bacterium]|nr:EAL domain-containing protein [Alphaproteobacteria bacterium]
MAVLHETQAERAHLRRLRRDLSTASEQEGFVLHYQPRVALRSGAVTGAEALIRWPHRKRGLMAPGSFIPIAEQAGLISDIGAWVLRAACLSAATWNRDLRVAVNVSARQLHDRELLRQIGESIEGSALPPERLEIELSESILLDDDLDTLLALSAIRDLGVCITLDDFGSGVASLSMLKRLPLELIKLDRSLVRTLPDDGEDVAIVQAIIDTSHALGLGVVAEGVETEAQRSLLAALGCDEAQGYLFSQPLPEDQFRANTSL